MNTIQSIWKKIYNEGNSFSNEIDTFIKELEQLKQTHFSAESKQEMDWYKDAIIYSTYADLFNKDIKGLTEKLDYIKDLGINCIWLLPILDSPMKDAGFDISDYLSVRPELLGLNSDATQEMKDNVFSTLIEEAHRRGIKIIFDIAMNHCSIEHQWFKEAKSSKDSPYRDYFIWSDTKDKYKEARIIFKGMCDSNWELEPTSNQYYFHRFFEIQPDLNYANPNVLINMTKVLVHWKIKGVDGFRADAVPYIWKEVGTICENLPKTHLVVKFFRAVLDYLSPGSLLLAEACQPPKEVVEYFGNDDECNAAYHFPVMPRIYKALAQEKKDSIEMALNPSFTPDIPANSQWFMFLRCHDELTLEMVTQEEREYIYNYYVSDSSWDFRQGEGISARLAELFKFNPDRILLANSIMFTLLGTPIVFYGDEFGKGNDVAFFDKVFKESGYADTRYLGRGTIDWDHVNTQLKDKDSLGYTLYQGIKKMIAIRSNHPAFGRGILNFIDTLDKTNKTNPHILAYKREYKTDKVLVLQNLSAQTQFVALDSLDFSLNTADLLGQPINHKDGYIELEGFEYLWL